jgi:cold shock CspA family protein
MARPQETFNKKELEKKRLQKRKEKEQRKEDRKANKESSSFEDMLAYVDENGNISSTPPDPTRKKTNIKTEDIVIGSRNNGSVNQAGSVRQGRVTFFNTSKGFGFIKDVDNGESIFVHSNGLSTPIKENDLVSFETERGFKGLNAVRVKVVK